MVVLKAENAKLRSNNKVLSLENLTLRNELTNNHKKIMNWRTKFTKLQAMHIHHVEILTTELQSYAEKLTGVFGNDLENDEIEITGRVTEHFTNGNSPAINDDPSTRVCKSLAPLKPDEKLSDALDDSRKFDLRLKEN